MSTSKYQSLKVVSESTRGGGSEEEEEGGGRAREKDEIHTAENKYIRCLKPPRL